MSLIIVFYAALLGLVASTLIGDLRMWFLGITIIDLSIQIDAYFGFDLNASALGSISGYNISLTTLSLPALYGAWLAGLLVNKHLPNRRPIVWAAGPLLLYFAWLFVSALLTPYNARVSTYEIFMLTQVLLLMIYIAGAIRTREELIFVLMFFVFGLIAQTIVIFAQRFLGILMYPGVSRFRPGGSFISPNIAGGFLFTVLTPLIAFLLAQYKTEQLWIRLVRLLAIVAIFIGMGALVLTQSRGSWIGFLTSVGILFVLLWYRGWLSSRLIWSVLSIGLIAAVILSPVIVDRLTGDDQGAALARGPLNEIALQVFREYPISGIGPNNYGLAMFNYIPPNLGSEWLFTVHNKYLLVLAENGIIGFLAFVAFLAFTFVRGVRVWMRADPFLSVIGLGITAALVGHYIHLAGDVFNARPMVQLLWTYSALLFAIDRIIMAERAPEPTK
jgi:O-antigen ligase